MSKTKQEDFEAHLQSLISERLDALPPREALEFLFRLDAFLYVHQGRQSVAYGDGLHSKHRHIRYHDYFVERLAEGETVLDIGCGNGALALSMAERAGALVTAIDLEAVHIEAARRNHAHPNITYVVGDALEEIPNDRFDTVVMSNVLEHLPERPAFLRRAMGSTGARRILLRVPTFERDWRVPLKKELGVEWRLDTTHYIEYRLDEFAEELSLANLTITDQRVNWGEIWAEAHPT
ncbi:class I SAM-dependent methyltransferase [Rhodospira trueperi]|uniref:class I SAM-dependent methyltransferase n=1 Tax=Rhodospira trueperi TaxID=69960 RepID=UPI0015A2F94E|nr:methyltransferase domain-containing protein [Rhodospira trueperi]